MAIQSIFHDQAQFMLAGKQTVGQPNCKQLRLYGKLVEEEYKEFEEKFLESEFKANVSSGEFELTPELVKEAADVIVVAAGFLVTALGPDRASEVWNLVHNSNMLKTMGGGEQREDGKILKNAEYKKALKERLMSALETLINR
jgi:predicted HAD superfamily Cof-like phosphohydrolase